MSSTNEMEPAKNKASGYTRAQQEQYSMYLETLHQDFMKRWEETHKIKEAKLEDFEKIQILGAGTFGAVYLVKHLKNGGYWAMKRLEKQRVVRLKQIEHSFNEKMILCCLNFPFVTYMEYFFKDNVFLYFVMPFINGGEMFTHLRRMGRFTESAAKFYGAQVLLAIEYLHACNLVYRDLKPENILFDQKGYIKITDYGFCKMVLGRTWTLCGTPEYLAPEVITSKGYGKTADWWSFGVLLYEMCAGFPPFMAVQPMKIYELIVIGKYKFASHFSKDLKSLLSHVLVVDITRRYGTLRNGILDFKNHGWFIGIYWDELLNGTLPAPVLPDVSSPGDTKYFEQLIARPVDESSTCLYEKEFEGF